MTDMATYRGGSGWDGAAWPTGDGRDRRHHALARLLTNKVYADGKGPRYTYSVDGKLAMRNWARTNGGPLATTYAYTNTGEMRSLNYSDATPDVNYTSDRLGQQATITDGQGTRTFGYDPYLQLTNETVVGTAGPGGPSTNVLVRTYDSLGRPTGFFVGPDLLAAPYSITYAYDSLGRFASVLWSNGVEAALRAASYS